MKVVKPVIVGMGLSATLLLGACATAGMNPNAIARLEQDRAVKPNSEPVLRALGIEYYKASRYPEARATLQQAATLDPKDGVTALYLGLTAEAQNDLPAARVAYSSYLQVGRTKKVRSELEARLSLLERKQMQIDAADAIKREATLSAVAGPPRTVAVLPFTFTGPDTTYKPLERGFAELLTTDLSRSPDLTVVDRARLQAILDELALQSSGATDAATSVRAGHLLAAGSLVSGSINQSGDQLRADAGIVAVASGTVAPNSATDNETVDQLFKLEETIVFKLFDALGVTITTAERNAIDQRPTKSLAAFLAYSRGLRAEDDGHFDDASRYFQDATRLDPGFAAAAQQRQATTSSPAAIEGSTKGTVEASVVNAAGQGNTGSGNNSSVNQTVQTMADGVNSSPTEAASQSGGSSTTTPPPTQSSANSDGTPGGSSSTPGSGATSHLPIVIKAPGGG